MPIRYYMFTKFEYMVRSDAQARTQLLGIFVPKHATTSDTSIAPGTILIS